MEFKNIDRSRFNLDKIIENYKKFEGKSMKDIDVNDLPDIRDLNLKGYNTTYERMLRYLELGYNPYFIRIGKRLVHLSYAENGPSLDELIADMLEGYDEDLSDNCIEKEDD